MTESDEDYTYAGALRRERLGYAARGQDDRVEQVDAELRRIGAEDEKPDKPRSRASREQRQSTADDTKPTEAS